MHPSILTRLAALRGRSAVFAALVLGALSAFALPPFFVIPVLLVSVPGLLTLVGSRVRARDAAWIGFWFGFGHHLVGLYWITDAILLVAASFWWLVPFAVPALAIVLALFIAAPCAAAWYARPGWSRALILAGAWLMADIARQFILTGFPWNPWGSVWAAPGGFGDVMIQLAAIIGTPGLTLLTVLLATTPLLGRHAMAGGVVVLAIWAGFGLWRLSLAAPPAPGLEVALIQGDVAEGQRWDQTRAIEIFRRYLTLTHDAVVAAAGKPVVAIWPETASPFLLTTDVNARNAVSAAAELHPVIAGTIRFDAAGKPRNSMAVIVDHGELAASYDKSHLVPFGEYEPPWLPIQVAPQGFVPGSGPRTLHAPGLPPFGALICYEAIFPGEVVGPGPRPDWLVNITNDAWFGNSTGPRQHLAAARMRAVEEGLPLMRAANTGISAGFDAFGREEGRIGIDRTATITLSLSGPLPPTPFSRFGLLIPLALALICLVVGLMQSRTKTPSLAPVS